MIQIPVRCVKPIRIYGKRIFCQRRKEDFRRYVCQSRRFDQVDFTLIDEGDRLVGSIDIYLQFPRRDRKKDFVNIHPIHFNALLPQSLPCAVQDPTADIH